MSTPPSLSTLIPTSSQFTYPNGSYFPMPFHLQQLDPSLVVGQYQKPYVAAPPPMPAPPVRVPVYPNSASAPAAGAYTLPQYQQAQQLFQRDAQTITAEALEGVKAAIANSEIENKAETKKKAFPRKAAGQTWEDPTLAEWPENDYRLFCGDLGNEVNDDVLSKAFSCFPSFNMAKVVRDKRTGKTRGFGFVSFSNPLDHTSALREMNGKYVGNRPIKLYKSNWNDWTDYDAMERQKHRTQKKSKPLRRGILHK